MEHATKNSNWFSFGYPPEIRRVFSPAVHENKEALAMKRVHSNQSSKRQYFGYGGESGGAFLVWFRFDALFGCAVAVCFHSASTVIRLCMFSSSSSSPYLHLFSWVYHTSFPFVSLGAFIVHQTFNVQRRPFGHRIPR
ncbi:hypothetical protein BDZ89DRAFT_275430 [Hymenopellis radicata]|nr:hypothetical protein BDZ89DRAFT_275430 [Hymenopellis radicata]